jgi:CRISPR system Cascade subunit CasA
MPKEDLMNLVTDPWLPVTDKNNKLKYISLNQLFEKPKEWIDLVLRPHERVSVMRLLICIVQAALDGPANIDEWDEALDKISEDSLSYLKKWQNHFDLYGSEKPFLQIKDLEPFNTEPTPITKLNFTLATGNNSTLFDHLAIHASKDIPLRTIQDSYVIISMITFNNFSLSGLYPQVKWQTKTTAKSGVKDAPCSSQSMLHCFVRKNTVIKTIHANIPTIEQISDRFGDDIGVPIWECFPSSPSDEKAIHNATLTYLGRLVPLSRWIKILPNKNSILMGEGFVYPVYPDFIEATSVEVITQTNNNQGYKILSCKNTTPWRELCALTTKRLKDNNIGGPAAIENQPKTEDYDLHILALKRDKQSVLDTIESVIHVPRYLANDNRHRTVYSSEVKNAEIQSSRLDHSIQRYLSFLKPDSIKVVEKGIKGEKLQKEASRKYQDIKNTVRSKYLTHYWTLIEKQRHLLMQYISLIGTDQYQGREESKKKWHAAIQSATEETYRTLCSQESPRQMQAYVAGWRLLNRSKSKIRSKEGTYEPGI